MLITTEPLLVLEEYNRDIRETPDYFAAADGCNNSHLLMLNVRSNITGNDYLTSVDFR